ncbi:uncharacterized protein LOC129875779 [Solanum dulcamara]|uniref:uncharacterized protein LOC129875779 n=1 Tax=Solanum dulcamara TaxID=45834 RepID=UPI00248688CC|nr:uncharacterized protein LOC129875779 [Solanum dulcamara]
MGTAKEAELMEREEFGAPKRACASSQFSGTSSGGRGNYRGGDSFQRRGPIHASMLAFKDGQTPRGSYSTGQSYHGSQQREGRGGTQPSSSVSVRGPAPPIRGRGIAQTSRGGRMLGRSAGGAIVHQGRGRGVGQVGGGRGS